MPLPDRGAGDLEHGCDEGDGVHGAVTFRPLAVADDFQMDGSYRGAKCLGYLDDRAIRITHLEDSGDVFLAPWPAGMRTKESVPLRQSPTYFLGVVCEFLQLFNDRSPIFT